MKKLLFLCVLLAALPLAAQNVRYDAPIGFGGQGATLQWCNVPANGVPCSNFATTYNSDGVACSNNAQDTSILTPSVCQPGPDQQGKIGVWAPPGSYQYTVCSGNSCQGPYAATLGGSGSAGVSSLNSATGGVTIAAGTGTTVSTVGNTITVSSTASGGNVSTAPAASQPIIQPIGTNLAINNFANIRYVTPAWNWIQNSIATTLTAGVQATVTLSAGKIGLDTSGNTTLGGPNGGYMVYISGDANPEAVYVTGGTYTTASGGTIIFTPFFSHTSAGYNIGSASSGIQEAINDGCGTSTTASLNNNCKIVIPATGPLLSNPYNVYGTVYFHGRNSQIEGYGATLSCYGRGPCLQIGNLTSSIAYISNTVAGLAFSMPVNIYSPCVITGTQRTSGVSTITTASDCGYRTGDMLTLMFTDSTNFRGDVPSITRVDGTHFTYPRSGATDIPASTTTAGLVALTKVAILDNSSGTHFVDIQLDSHSPGGFAHFFDMWDDEAAEIIHYNNNGIGNAVNNTWMGYTVYSGGQLNLPSTTQNLAPVIRFVGGSITNANCFYLQNSNSLYVKDTICQNSISQAVVKGGLHGASFENLYSETPVSTNGSTSSPWGGLGVAGLIAGTNSEYFSYKGIGFFTPPQTVYPTVGSTGSVFYTYYVVAHDTTAATVSKPLLATFTRQSAAGSITVQWPRLVSGNDSITYDLIRVPATGAGSTGSTATTFPTTTACVGGAANVCGSVVTGQAQQSGFIQSFTDDTTVSTTAYTVAPFTLSPNPDFWPGTATLGAVLYAPQDSASINNVANIGASIVAGDCSLGQNALGSFTACLNSATTSNNSIKNQAATILTDGGYTGGGMANTKGRLNFMQSSQSTTGSHDIITLVDSDPLTTLVTQQWRPTANVNDTAIGIDSGSVGLNATKLGFRSPSAISSYIGSIFDGSSFKERLTSSAKTINVNTTINGNLTVTGTCTGCSGSGSVWSSIGNPAGNLALSLGTNTTTFTSGDFGASPGNSTSYTDSSTTSTDTSFNLLVDTGASSFHSPFGVKVQGTNQFQIWRPTVGGQPQGQIVFGSNVGLATIDQTPFAKVVMQSGTAAHDNLRIFQGSTSATGTMNVWNNATAAGTGFFFFKANTGCTDANTGCDSGTTTASLRGDGLLTVQNLTLPTFLQGKELVVGVSGAITASNEGGVDCSQYTSAGDMSQALLACESAYPSAGIYDATGFTGTQTWSRLPWTNGTTKGKIKLGCVVSIQDTFGSIGVPTGLGVEGCGVDGSTGSSTTAINGTLIWAGAGFPTAAVTPLVCYSGDGTNLDSNGCASATTGANTASPVSGLTMSCANTTNCVPYMNNNTQLASDVAHVRVKNFKVKGFILGNSDGTVSANVKNLRVSDISIQEQVDACATTTVGLYVNASGGNIAIDHASAEYTSCVTNAPSNIVRISGVSVKADTLLFNGASLAGTNGLVIGQDSASSGISVINAFATNLSNSSNCVNISNANTNSFVTLNSVQCSSSGALNLLSDQTTPTGTIALATVGNIGFYSTGVSGSNIVNSNFNLTGPQVTQVTNAGTTGTSLNKLAKLTGAPSTALIAATSDTSGIVGIVSGGAGTSGRASIAVDGQALCVFDGSTVSGDYVQISSTVAGDCHDAGSTKPTTGQIVGRVLTTNGAGGTYNVYLYGPDVTPGGGGGGSGNVTATTLTSGTLPVATGATSIANSSLTDSGGTLTYSGANGVSAPTVTTTSTGAGFFNATEGTKPVCATSQDILAADPTIHWWMMCANNTSYEPVAGVNGSITTGNLALFPSANEVGDSGIAATSVTLKIASGTAALGTSSIATGVCATAVTVGASGVATTDVIAWTPNADISAVTGYSPSTNGGLIIYAYPTANNVNFKVCNPTTSSITPGAVTLNWRVSR